MPCYAMLFLALPSCLLLVSSRIESCCCDLIDFRFDLFLFRFAPCCCPMFCPALFSHVLSRAITDVLSLHGLSCLVTSTYSRLALFPLVSCSVVSLQYRTVHYCSVQYRTVLYFVLLIRVILLLAQPTLLYLDFDQLDLDRLDSI